MNVRERLCPVGKINVALIGYGYWGPNLARNIVLNSSYQLVAVVDQDEKRRSLANALYGVLTFSSYEKIDDSLKIDLVVICTRPSSHKFLASYFIKNQMNVLITKPCGMSSMEADEIATLAEECGAKVFCDFTYHFSPLINFLTSNPLATEIVSEMREYTSYRTSLGIVQSDVDVLADLAVHDIYILLLLKSELPIFVNCLKTNFSDNSQLNAAFLTLTWADGFTAAIHVSWNSPKKVRFISIASKDRGVILEEMNREAPIQLVHFAPNDLDYVALTAEERYTRNVSFTMGNLEVPQIEMYEALGQETQMIAQALNAPNSGATIPTARSAANVWKVIEALRESNRLGGVAQNV
jgi:predicted dehydrogenase